MIACDLINMTPVVLNCDTFYQIWYSKCAYYSILRIFGCVAFSHQSEGKLEAKTKKCIFKSYPAGVKGYKLWVRSQKDMRIVVSHYITFN